MTKQPRAERYAAIYARISRADKKTPKTGGFGFSKCFLDGRRTP